MMNDTTRDEGFWWLPESPDQLSKATLVIEGGRARLESVLGPLGDKVLDMMYSHTGHPIIHGRTNAGTRYTCVRNIYSGIGENKTPTGGHAVAKISISRLFKPGHFERPADLKFGQGHWVYSNLHKWLFEIDPILVTEVPERPTHYEIEHNRSGLWESKVGDGITLINDYSFQYAFDKKVAFVKFTHADGISISSIVPRPYEEYLILESRFRALVNLVADCQLEISRESFRPKANGPGQVDLLGVRGGEYARRSDPGRDEAPIRFKALTNFSTIIESWFSQFDRLEPIVNLYLYGKFNGSLDFGTVFLGIMQALEAFHRAFHPGVFMPKDEYEAVRRTINAAIPPEVSGDFRTRLRSAIEFGYEYSLRRRLSELLSTLPAGSLFDEVRNSAFRARSVDTRNAMTHQIAPTPEFKTMEGAELYNATQIWREALFALILARIGVPEPLIVEAVTRLRGSRGEFIAI